MLDAQKLQEMKDKHIISEEDMMKHKRHLAAKIIGKNKEVSSVNGIVYALLAFFLGTLGVHNFYGRYWKRGLVQLFLTIIAQYALYIPLLFTSLWAEMELLLVNRDPKGRLFKGSRKIIWFLRLGSVVILVWGFMSIKTANFDAMFQMMDELYGVVKTEEMAEIEQM